MTQSPAPGERSIGSHMVRGSAWMVAMRWTIRSIGLISTIILARLLVPADFGIVAMGMVVVGFLEVFSYTGVDLALIQNAKATRHHYDTAWTIQVFQGVLLASILVLAAPLAAYYFDEPRVVLVIRLLALRSIIGGFQNIGVVAFRKELHFAKEFRFGVYQKLLTFGLTISLAFYLRSYWALVAGMVAGRILEVALSYGMHAYRPRFSLMRLRELASFSVWMLVFHVGQFLGNKTDEFVVGGLSGSAIMGNYYVASSVSTMPTNELIMPLGRALFPGYAKLSDSPQKMAEMFRKVLGILGMLCFPVGIGLAAVAGDVVSVLLGAKWEAAVPLVQWLAVFGAIGGITFGFQPFFVALGRVRLFAALTWIQLGVLVPIMALAGNLWGVTEIAIARTAVAVLFLPTMCFFTTRISPITLGQLAAVLWRPLAAAAIMWVTVKAFHMDMIDIPVVRLGLDVMVGAVTFALAQLTLWWLSGRPDGTERALLTFVASKLRGPAKT